MAYRAKQPAMSNGGKQFPPEADDVFDVVPEAEIATWREKLNQRFGIGTGKLKPVEDIKAAH